MHATVLARDLREGDQFRDDDQDADTTTMWVKERDSNAEEVLLRVACSDEPLAESWWRTYAHDHRLRLIASHHPKAEPKNDDSRLESLLKALGVKFETLEVEVSGSSLEDLQAALADKIGGKIASLIAEQGLSPKHREALWIQSHRDEHDGENPDLEDNMTMALALALGYFVKSPDDIPADKRERLTDAAATFATSLALHRWLRCIMGAFANALAKEREVDVQDYTEDFLARQRWMADATGKCPRDEGFDPSTIGDWFLREPAET